MRFTLCGLIICTTGLMTGCNLTKPIFLLSAPNTEKVAPEFNRLPEKKVLVYVWAPPEIRFDYPKVCLDLSAYVSGYLKENVEKIELVDPVRIESYVEKSNTFENDPIVLGKHFKADMVIHLCVYKFSMRDPGMANFYRGRISSSVTVFDLTKEDALPERIPLKDVIIAVPENNSIGFYNADPLQVRQATYNAFAVELGKKFHEYERPLD